VYPDPVRVVAIGSSVDDLLAAPDADQNLGYSVEFCGGTHLTNTAQVWASKGGGGKGAWHGMCVLLPLLVQWWCRQARAMVCS
jgi:hypothetical protein